MERREFLKSIVVSVGALAGLQLAVEGIAKISKEKKNGTVNNESFSFDIGNFKCTVVSFQGGLSCPYPFGHNIACLVFSPIRASRRGN